MGEGGSGCQEEAAGVQGWDSGHGGGEAWTGPVCILRVELTGLPDGLDVGGQAGL